MPPRTGRPPKENPKDIRIQIRLEELQKLDECVKREASTRSEIVRKGIDLVYTKGENK